MSKRLLMNNVKKATVITYNITYELTEVTLDNNITSIEEGQSYTANVIVADGYEISHVMILIGVTDITDTCYADGVINIDSVIGDIEITIVAKEAIEFSEWNEWVINVTGSGATVYLYSDRRGDTTTWDKKTDWGDGTSNSSTYHLYTKTGTYTIRTKYCFYSNSGSPPSNFQTNYQVVGINKINCNMTNFNHLFRKLNITEIDLSKFDLSKVTTINNCFRDSTVTSVKLPKELPSVTSIGYCFAYAKQLTDLDLSEHNLPNCTDMNHLCSFCTSLKTVNLSRLNAPLLQNLAYIFIDTTSLERVDMSYMNIKPISSTSYICEWFLCQGSNKNTTLTYIDFSGMQRTNFSYDGVYASNFFYNRDGLKTGTIITTDCNDYFISFINSAKSRI